MTMASTESTASAYEPDDEVVDFISTYMNEAHSEALQVMASAYGVKAERVEIASMTAIALILRALDDDGIWQTTAITWPAPLRRREDIRTHLQQMQDDAWFSQW